MKTDSDIKFDYNPPFWDALNFQPLTLEKLEAAMWKIQYNDKIKSFVLGFTIAEDNEAWVVDRDYRTQDDKSIILIKAKGLLHKKLTELEEKYDFKFDRINEKTIDALSGFGLTDENGYPYLPKFLKQFDPSNLFVTDKQFNDYKCYVNDVLWKR